MAKIEMKLVISDEPNDDIRHIIETASISLSKALDLCSSEIDWRMLGLASAFAARSIQRGDSLWAIKKIAETIQDMEPGVVDDIDVATMAQKELSDIDKLSIGIRQLQNHIADTIMNAVAIDVGVNGQDDMTVRERAVAICRDHFDLGEAQTISSRAEVRDLLVRVWRAAADMAESVYIED